MIISLREWIRLMEVVLKMRRKCKILYDKLSDEMKWLKNSDV